MKEQERKMIQNQMGYVPEWYMNEERDIRHFFNWINKDSVLKVAESIQNIKLQSEDTE